jgi:hypothetical protein
MTKSKKPIYVKTTSGATYRLGDRLIERVHRDTHRVMDYCHFMTRYDLNAAIDAFMREDNTFEARVYRGSERQDIGRFPVLPERSSRGVTGMKIGCNRVSKTTLKTLSKWAKGQV